MQKMVFSKGNVFFPFEILKFIILNNTITWMAPFSMKIFMDKLKRTHKRDAEGTLALHIYTAFVCMHTTFLCML